MYPLDQQVNAYNAVNGSWTFSRAANDVFGQISALRNVTVGGFAHDIQTYVVGMGDTVANPSSVAAMNQFANLGGTGTAYLAQDSTSLAAAFQAIAVDIESKTAAASSVSLNTGSWGTGTNLYQARFNSGDWSGQLISYAINADGSIGAQQWDSGQVINGQNWDTGRTILTYKPSAALGARGIRLSLARELPGDTVGDGDGLGAGRPAECTGRNLGRRIEQRGVVERWRVRHGVELLQLRIRARAARSTAIAAAATGAVVAAGTMPAMAIFPNGCRSISAARRASRRRSCTRYRTSIGRRPNRPIR